MQTSRGKTSSSIFIYRSNNSDEENQKLYRVPGNAINQAKELRKLNLQTFVLFVCVHLAVHHIKGIIQINTQSSKTEQVAQKVSCSETKVCVACPQNNQECI